MPVQDGPDARGGQGHTHPGELTLDPPVAPGGILPGQSEDDRHRASRNARSTWAVGIDPFPSDQVPVPAEQSLGLDEEPSSTAPIKQPTQSGEQCSIGRPEGRSDHLTTEHGNLVSEHDDFNGQLVAVAATEEHQLENSDEGEVDKRQGHGPVSSPSADSRKCCSDGPDDILGTHTVCPQHCGGMGWDTIQPNHLIL